MRVVDPKVAYSMLHREVPPTQQPFHQLHGPSQAGRWGWAVLGRLGAPGPAAAAYRPPAPRLNQAAFGSAPFQQPRFGGPPRPAATAPAVAPANNEDEQNAQMLIRVMQLTDEQIRCLSQEDQAKVVALRRHLNAPRP